MKVGQLGQLLETLGPEALARRTLMLGMAGSFGFQTEHYELSLKCAERVLLPAVRAAAADDLLIADGFSCREQIFQATGRRPLHLAEVLERALTAATP